MSTHGKSMSDSVIEFSRGDLDKVRTKYQELCNDPRSEGLPPKQLVRLATRLALMKNPMMEIPRREVKAPLEKKEKKEKKGKKSESKEEKESPEDIVGLEGEGIIDDGIQAVKKVGKKVLDWIAPKSMSANVKKMMSRYSSEVISGIRVCRVPIVSVIEKFLRFVSGDKIKPEYDKIYHLYMLIYLRGGTILRVERNQTFQMQVASPKDINMSVSEELPEDVKGPASVTIKVPGSITLGEAMKSFIEEAQNRNPKMGPWRYASMSSGDIPSNNCQDMVISWLKGMGVLTFGVEKFVKQDIDKLLPEPANQAQQAITDVAGAVGQHLLGKGKGKRLHTIGE